MPRFGLRSRAKLRTCREELVVLGERIAAGEARCDERHPP